MAKDLAYKYFLLSTCGAAIFQADTWTPSVHAYEGADSGSLFEEIVVVAQKRAENIQDVPISIAALTAGTIEKANITKVTDLGRLVTNFSASENTQTSNLRLTIRGIGAPGNTATEPSVATFVDGIYMPRPGSIIGSFLDIESVQVLRGPQGTLFGRNASVGALVFNSVVPKDQFSASLSGEYGTANRTKLSGHVNLPLTENVAVRVAALGQWFNGYWRNRADGEKFGGLDDVAVKGSMKARAGIFDWVIRADYSSVEGNGFPNTSFVTDSVSEDQLAAFEARLGGNLPDTVQGDQYGNQHITADVNDRQWGVSSDISADVQGYTIKLLNSYRDWRNDQLDGDVVFTPLSLLSRIENRVSTTHSHELQLISPKDQLLDGRFDFVAGLYYFNEDYRIDEQLQLGSLFCQALVPAGLQPTCVSLMDEGLGVDATDQDFSQSVEDFSAYGQATYALAETLDLTLGGRWSTNSKKGHYLQAVNNPFTVTLRGPEDVALALDDDQFSWRISLNWTPEDDLLLFANYSTGYKSGGFNSGGSATALNERRIFDSETTKNYELGIKSQWFGGMLRVNTTLYRMDISGFQDRSFDGVSFVVRNAGSLRHQGVEFDASFVPNNNFSLNASFAYLDSEFTDYPQAAGLPGLGGVQDLKGARNAYAPEVTASLAAEWIDDVGSSGLQWSINGNISITSDANIGAVTDNNPQSIQDGYALIGARLSLLGAEDKWSLTLFGNNLTNTTYCVQKFYQVLDSALGLRNGVFPGSTAIRCQESNPRTIGIAANIRF